METNTSHDHRIRPSLRQSSVESVTSGGPPIPIEENFALQMDNSETSSSSSSSSSVQERDQIHALEHFTSKEDVDANAEKVESHHHNHHSRHSARAVPVNWQAGQSAWPQTNELSFTRALVFYGKGSASHEHVRAAKFIIEARRLREKYFGAAGVSVDVERRILAGDNLAFEAGMGLILL